MKIIFSHDEFKTVFEGIEKLVDDVVFFRFAQRTIPVELRHFRNELKMVSEETDSVISTITNRGYLPQQFTLVRDGKIAVMYKNPEHFGTAHARVLAIWDLEG